MPFAGAKNDLWKYDISSNSWSWVSGYSSIYVNRNNSVPHYRYAMGSAGDNVRYGYIFGGDVSDYGDDIFVWYRCKI
jgi:hypothetical protein